VTRAKFLKHTESWKKPVIFLLNAVTGTTAVLNTLLLVLSENSLGLRYRTAISCIPIALAVIICFTLLCSWWLSLRQYTLIPVLPPVNLQENPTENPPSVLTSVVSPAWGSFTDDDGDTFWYNSELGISAWELPPGAITSCGWRHEGGVWKNTLNGAISDTPPGPTVATPTLKKEAPSEDGPLQPENVWVQTEDDENASGDVFWHNPFTGESVWTLPPGAETSCGWREDLASGLWRHRPSGAERLSLPPRAYHNLARSIIKQAALRSEEYQNSHQAVHEWVRTGSEEFAWFQPSTETKTVTELPPDAHTSCGWWFHEGLHMWVHKGSGATSKIPPSPNPELALSHIKAHLRSQEARERPVDPSPWLLSTEPNGIDTAGKVE